MDDSSVALVTLGTSDLEAPVSVPQHLLALRKQSTVELHDGRSQNTHDDNDHMGQDEAPTEDRSFVRIEPFLASYVYLTVSATIYTAVMQRLYHMFHLAAPVPTHQQPVPAFRFPGCMPMSLMRKHIGTTFRPSECMVSPKTNGTRCFFLLMKFNDTPMTFLINRRLKVLLLPGMGTRILQHAQHPVLRGKEDPTALYDGTLLDGDVVTQNGTGRYLYVPHDIIVTLGDNDLTATPYSDRVVLLQELLRQDLVHASDHAPLVLREKPIVPAHRVRWLVKEEIPKLDYGSDGLTFTDRNAPVETGTSQHTWKWKDFIEHTTELRAAVKIVAPPLPPLPPHSQASAASSSLSSSSIPAAMSRASLDPRDVVIQLFMSGGPDSARQPKTTPVMLCEQSLIDTFGRALCATHHSLPQKIAQSTTTASAASGHAQRLAFLQDTDHVVAWKDASFTNFQSSSVRPEVMRAYLDLINGTVAEFYYNPHTGMYHFRNTREDKDFPNTYFVVRCTQDNVRENITLDQVFQLCEHTAVGA